MLKITTESGSIYLIDEENKQATRVLGNKPPTERLGTDCVWKKYVSIAVGGGNCLFIDWTGKGNGTLTSKVTLVEEYNENCN